MALDFVRANSDYLDCGSANPITAYPFSFACWVNVNDTSQEWEGVVSQGHWGTNPSGFWFDATSGNSSAKGKPQLALYNATTGTEVYAANALTSGTWQSLIVTVTSSNIIFYIDGILDVTRSHSQGFLASSTHNLYLGTENDGNNSPTALMDGSLAEIAIWNTELSLAHTKEHAAGVEAILIDPAGLVRFWRMTDATFPSIDIVGSQDGALGTAPDKTPHPRIIRAAKQRIVFPPAAAAAAPFLPYFNKKRPNVLLRM